MAKEAVDFDLRREKLNAKLRDIFPATPNSIGPWISGYFDEYIIVELEFNDYRRIPYTVNGEEVELADKIEWVKVERQQNWVKVLEAVGITPHYGEGKKKEEFEGREWEITIIGAKEAADLVEVDGKEYIRSKNGRLYSVDALIESVPLWEGIKVYDNHLTQEEFEAKQGMRSPVKEWLGTIVSPWWNKAENQIRGIFKVVDEALGQKLKNAWEQKVLGSIGLSIDTFPVMGQEAIVEGQRMPIIEGFKKILSVDLVGDPAAGGGFNRLIASMTNRDLQEDIPMTPEELKAMIQTEVVSALKDAVTATVKTALAEALAEDEPEKPEPEATPVEAAQPDPVATQATEAVRRLECKILLRDKIEAAKLPAHFAEAARKAFDGRIFEEKEVDDLIKSLKEAQASQDPSGRASEAGQTRTPIVAGLNEDDKFAIEFMRLVMGNEEFNQFRRASEHHPYVDERVREYRRDARFLEAWEKDGKPELRSFNRMSTLLETWLGGNPLLDGRVLETASTSSLATVVKNTVNIMVAADYSKRHLWYEPLVRVQEVDTIDDLTLARLFGANTLSTVVEGGPYTELNLQDEEETANFVKKGNYIGVTMETLMRDKISYIRSIPQRMSNAWYNTLSSMTGAVFTTNSAAGPVLADTGALFNATATSSAGGHANLLTTALSYSSYSAGRTAMRKQTDQPLGAGQKLQITPKYLLVPEDLETTANTVRNSEHIPGSANNDVNQFYQKFEVVPVPTFTDANDWAQMADPAMWPSIWHVFPRGGRTPQLFTADSEVSGAMFTNDTLRFKIRLTCYHFSDTYDVAPVSDWRPLLKHNVA